MCWRAYAHENKYIVLLEPDPSPRMGVGSGSRDYMTALLCGHVKGSANLMPHCACATAAYADDIVENTLGKDNLAKF